MVLQGCVKNLLLVGVFARPIVRSRGLGNCGEGCYGVNIIVLTNKMIYTMFLGLYGMGLKGTIFVKVVSTRFLCKVSLLVGKGGVGLCGREG